VAPDQAVIRELAAHRNSSIRNHSLAEAIIPVGGTVTEHYHKITEEVYYLISGKGLMYLNGVEREVGPGDIVIIPPGTKHKLTNHGFLPIVMVVTCAPGWEAADQVLTEG
jgi:mannose-6-phosphate isomerase-like protein (cupin superfamily)